jgi:hypothetical protein
VPRRVQHANAQLADDQRLAIVDAHVCKRRGAEPMHDDRRVQLPPELARSREVIGVGVGLGDVVDSHPTLGRERDVAIELVEVRVDDHAGARDVVADQIRQTSAGTDLLEQHDALYRNGIGGSGVFHSCPC